MLTLKFKNLRDEQPLPQSRISFYVAKDSCIRFTGGIEADGEMRNGKVGLDWVGVEDYGASSCCYGYDDPEQNKFEIGACTKFLEEGETDPEGVYTSYKKMMYLAVDNEDSHFIFPFTSDNPLDDEDAEILWEYEHRIRYNVFSQTQLGQDSFPSPYIKELMEDGLLWLIDTNAPKFTEITCEHSGYKYKHVELLFSWLGNTWKVKGAQEGKWEEGAWLNGEYAEMGVYSVEKENK